MATADKATTNAARRRSRKTARGQKAQAAQEKRARSFEPKPVEVIEEDAMPQGPPPWIDDITLTNGDSAKVGMVIYIDPKLVRRDKGQPRQEFDKTLLEGLAKSIWYDGQEEPAHVYIEPGEDGCEATLINGERRWRACSSLDMPLMAIVKTVPRSAQRKYLGQIISNESQEKLSPVDEAKAIQKALDLGSTMEEVARAFNKSKAWCYQRIKLLEFLSKETLNLMSLDRPEKERLGSAVALELTRVPRHLQYRMALNHIGKPIGKARREIRDELGDDQRGSDINALHRTRTPCDDRVVMEDFLDRVADRSDDYSKFRPDVLERMFSSLPKERRGVFLNKLQRAKNNLNALCEAVEGLEVFK